MHVYMLLFTMAWSVVMNDYQLPSYMLNWPSKILNIEDYSSGESVHNYGIL